MTGPDVIQRILQRWSDFGAANGPGGITEEDLERLVEDMDTAAEAYARVREQAEARERALAEAIAQDYCTLCGSLLAAAGVEERARCAHPDDCDEVGNRCSYSDCAFGPAGVEEGDTE